MRYTRAMFTPRGFIFGLIGLFIFAGGLFWILVEANTPAPAGGPQPNALSLGSATSTAATSTAETFGSTTSSSSPTTLTIHTLPLGDGKVSSSPRVGFIYSCTPPSTSSSRVAASSSPWIHGAFWDATQKPTSGGRVFWPQASFSNVVQGATRFVFGNGLPMNEPTGIFPVPLSDPSALYGRDTAGIQESSFSYALPANPIFAATPSCLPINQPIGVTLDGVPLYSGVTSEGLDAGAHDVQDLCGGRTDSHGQYYYSSLSSCIPHINGRNTVIGYARDGFPITSLYDAQGKPYTNAALDACHGTTAPITMGGKTVTMYHYVFTREYPYTLGCFRGSPVSNTPGLRPSSTASSTSP